MHLDWDESFNTRVNAMIIHERVLDIMAKVQIRKLFVHEFVMKFIIHRFKHVFWELKMSSH